MKTVLLNYLSYQKVNCNMRFFLFLLLPTTTQSHEDSLFYRIPPRIKWLSRIIIIIQPLKQLIKEFDQSDLLSPLKRLYKLP